MKHMRRTLILFAMITSMLVTGSLGPTFETQAASAAQPANGNASPVQGSESEGGSEGTLSVFAGRTMILQFKTPVKRISITNDKIASTMVVSPTQLMIHGLEPGTVTLLLWDQQERLQSFNLQVRIDTRSIISELKQIFPEENIEVSQSGAAIVLNGEVSDQSIIDRAVALGNTQASSVVSTMWVRPPSRETIMLKVRFAEVDRSATQELGVNFINTGAGNTIGTASTQMYGNTTLDVNNDTATFDLTDLLNIFIFNPDVNLAMFIRALQQDNLLQILAEPNLLAANGQEASFLAGGEIPVPIVQSGQNQSVTIEWKEFGVRLKFKANVLDDGKIRLKIAPEVSSLDYANAVTIGGFLVPALTSRKTETEVELENGQSFAIAGLLDNRFRDTMAKIPGLGDIPLLGKLFRSKGMNKNQTELMVLVTPTVVKPSEPGQEPPLPDFPEQFLDKEMFDRHRANSTE